jgi:prepilin-type processing-associated H-X9-DG protein
MTNMRHGGKIVVGFVDGHVEILSPQQAKQLHWEP